MSKVLEVSDETWEKIKDQVGEDEVKKIDDLKDLVGEKYAFQCARYIYYGKIINVTSSHIVLKDASIVYDTGELDASSASDAQSLPRKTLNLMRQAVESFWKPKWD